MEKQSLFMEMAYGGQEPMLESIMDYYDREQVIGVDLVGLL
jgi:hypothetical protein